MTSAPGGFGREAVRLIWDVFTGTSSGVPVSEGETCSKLGADSYVPKIRAFVSRARHNITHRYWLYLRLEFNITNYLFDEGNNITTNHVGSFCITAMNTPESLFFQPFSCVIVPSPRYNISLVRGKKEGYFYIFNLLIICKKYLL